MLSSLLTQFRQRYPQGRLTSDLLTLHDGLYVVRVCAGADGTTLACGLSAQATLEQAEDRATTRALERLGLTALESGAGTATVSVSAPVAIAPLPSTAPASPPLTLVPQPSAPVPSQPADPAPAATVDAPSVDSPPTNEHFSNEHSKTATLAPEDEPDDLPLEAPSVALSMPPAAKPSSAFIPETLPDPDDNFSGLGIEPVAPVDLSDIIAQTDVELQRLGWDVNQGREFLEKTYGKRSRHDLTDDELLEFLLFLETQSPPSTP